MVNFQLRLVRFQLPWHARPQRSEQRQKADWAATALPLIQLFFWHAGRRFASFQHAQPAAG